MNNNDNWVELARLPLAKMQDILLARFIGRDEGAKMGFTPVMLTHLATAISEIGRNVIQHSGCAGEIHIGQLTQGDKQGLRIIVSDKGKGIESPERFLEEGKIGTLGAGLAGTQRLVDHFQIQTAPGLGTTVTMDFLKRETAT